jgi:hypothetical protein
LPDVPIDQSEASVVAGNAIVPVIGLHRCHTAPAAPDDPVRVPLRLVASKYKPAALADFSQGSEKRICVDSHAEISSSPMTRRPNSRGFCSNRTG